MTNYVPSGRTFILLYFAGLILAGTVLLCLPFAWNGETPVSLVDALFTATSAVAVTGLSVLNTATWSWFGKLVIMLLIQAGGLGVVTVVLMALARANAPVSIHTRKILGDYFLPNVENQPRRIIIKVLLYAFAFELAGAVALYIAFESRGIPHSWFHALFHAVSAFCNAGFSTFSNNLESFAGTQDVSLIICLLIISGGLGFVVHDDIRHRLLGKTRRLRAHTILMLGGTLVALVSGTALFALLEWNSSLAFLDGSPLAKVHEAFVMAVQPRTAGFDTIPTAGTSFSSQILAFAFMLVGGGPSSTAGGLKVTTVAILVLAVIRGIDGGSDLKIGRRRIDGGIVNQAAYLAVRMAMLVMLLLFLLVISETALAHKAFSVFQLAFETISAFCTVGLSLGISSELSIPGKLIIVATMYIGRIGLLALAFPKSGQVQRLTCQLPKEEVMIG